VHRRWTRRASDGIKGAKLSLTFWVNIYLRFDRLSQESALLQPSERLLRNGLAVIFSFNDVLATYENPPNQTPDSLIQKA
jgi:hypothetical protein